MSDEVAKIAALEREALIDAIAADLKKCGNDHDMVNFMAAGAKALEPGTPVHIPGRPFCVGFVAYGVTEGLQVNVTSTLDNMTGAIFAAPAASLAVRAHLQENRHEQG